MKIRTVVIDDEYQNRELLMDKIQRYEDFEIVGQADRVKSGLELINEKKPDVVFLDIRMPDGNGFELLDKIANIDFLVVFVSAFDNYALKAFDFNAVDYVLKPIDQSKFEIVIQKLLLLVRNQTIVENGMRQLLDQYDLDNLIIKKIQVHSGNKVAFLLLSDIVSAKSNEGSTLFKTISGGKYNSAKQLADFEFIFEGYSPMVRINKSVYINVNHIESYSKGFTCIIFMKDGGEFEVSRRKKTEILSILSTSS
jgi:two-component system LytT family response regulator